MMAIFFLWLLAAGFENCAFFCCRLAGRFDDFVLIGMGRNEVEELVVLAQPDLCTCGAISEDAHYERCL
jgi:hypothetical protein